METDKWKEGRSSERASHLQRFDDIVFGLELLGADLA